MRHRNKKIKLGRKTAHRSSMLANMACSLIEHKRINTTVTKAKALKQFIEPLVTKTKNDSIHNRRIVFRYLRNKVSVSDLFRSISNKIGDRPGGYTRIIKLGKRMGDNADMAMIEFVDFNELYTKSDTSKKTTRRGRSKSKSKVDKISDTDLKSPEISLKNKTKSTSQVKEDKKASEKEDKKASEKEDKKASEKEDKKASEKED
jgi:large subunit ribosomal protein L17